jgi:hypothetical protein
MNTFKTQLQLTPKFNEEYIVVFPTKPVQPDYCKKEGHTMQIANSAGKVSCLHCREEEAKTNTIYL